MSEENTEVKQEVKSSKKVDTYSYKGWLISDEFVKRTCAVFGYYMVGNLIISGAIFGVVVIIALILGGIGALFS